MTWQSIIDEHGEAIFRVAYRLLGSVHDAEDVSQEVLLEAFRMPEFPDASLLKRVAALRSIDRLRKRVATEPLADDISQRELQSVEKAVENQESVNLLREAISRLPRQQARCFWLRYVEGLSNQQIAAAEAISESTVSTALCKARQSLRRIFVRQTGGYA
ncbi:MAG: sigma-70 family RNA polymerase sigma factor [Planctomycetales bacterium]|nr:sigma-70 family RNA polymerase sigma factor [Planctomycetales bacterium]